MRKQTKEQAAELRANYHALAAQAAQIAENYLLEHPDTVPGVVYGGATGAVYKYLGNQKYRVQPFEVICLWWIRHRLLIHKSKQEDNMIAIPEKIKKKIIELRLSGVTNEKTAEITETSVSTVGRIMREYRDSQKGFVDAGECTEEQRKQLTDEITALTDKGENGACEAAENAYEFDIVEELEFMIAQLREMLSDRFGDYRIIAASAENNSATIKYRTAYGLMNLEITRCE